MTEITHKDHFGSPIEIGREYVYVHHTGTSVAFARVKAAGFTPKMVKLDREGYQYGHCYGDKLFPVPAE